MRFLNILFWTSFLLVTISACKKKETEEPNPTSSENDLSTNATYYFIFKKGDKVVKLEQSKNGIYNGSASTGSNDYLMCGGTFAKVNDDFSIKEFGNLYYGKDYGTCCPESADTYGAFSTGDGVYGKEDTKSGFILYYLDPNGVVWSTDYSTADQTSSTIYITSKSAYSDFSISYIVEGTFECTFYNAAGDSFKATNGKFKTMFAYQ